jgi:uncharacterized RmlC-like cupin family protein
MTQPHDISIHPFRFKEIGKSSFSQFLLCDEFVFSVVEPGDSGKLFCHKTHVDNLIVVKGELVLITLFNREYRYTYMSEDVKEFVKIPPFIPHKAINFGREACTLANVIQRLRPEVPSDYRPIEIKLDYDFQKARDCYRTRGRK